MQALVRRNVAFEACGIVNILGRGIKSGPRTDVRRQVSVVVDALAGNRQVEHVPVAKNAGFAGLRQNDELMGEISADRPGLRRHRNGFQPHARKGAQVGDEHLVVGDAGGGLVDIEGIGILHQEFTPAHHAEARALLVAEFPLNMIENLRQIAIGANVGAEDFRDHLLVGRAIQHLPLVPIFDAQHFGAIRVVTAALAPEIGKLQRRHQEFDRAGTVLLLPHDLLDLLEHAKAERKPGVDAGGLLADESCPQHQAVRDDLRLFRGLAQDRQEVAG